MMIWSSYIYFTRALGFGNRNRRTFDDREECVELRSLDAGRCFGVSGVEKADIKLVAVWLSMPVKMSPVLSNLVHHRFSTFLRHLYSK